MQHDDETDSHKVLGEWGAAKHQRIAETVNYGSDAKRVDGVTERQETH